MGRLLVTYSNASNYVPTTAEYLASFALHSRWDVRYLHVTHGAELGVDLGEFDAVLQSYCARLPIEGHVSDAFIQAMRAFRGIKAIAIQDEYDHTNLLRARLVDIGYDLVLTCIPEDQIARVYPPEMFPTTRFVPVLTGYVPDSLANRPPPAPIGQRPIMLGYRGRDIGPRYGRLAFDKLEIGRRMKEICAARGIGHDIEWTEDKRIYGSGWYDWLGSCRAVLGTESGSNVFDWDGEVTREFMTRGGPSYDEFLPWLAEREKEWNIGQISPRVFEAAACHTPMILFEGRYSGILAPEEHYIPLAKDFRNVNKVLDRLNRPQELEAMADRAHRHLIGSGTYSYERFVEQVEGELNFLMGGPGREPLPIERYAAPANDPISLVSLVEMPTLWPKPPVYFYFKQAQGQVDRLLPAMAVQRQLLDALGARLNEERAAHAAMREAAD